MLDARRRVGYERFKGPWRAILGSEHWPCADDASGTQELCHLGRTQPNRQLLCYWKRRQQSQNLELSEPQIVKLVTHSDVPMSNFVSSAASNSENSPGRAVFVG